jgi:hypothetical protein
VKDGLLSNTFSASGTCLDVTPTNCARRRPPNALLEAASRLHLYPCSTADPSRRKTKSCGSICEMRSVSGLACVPLLEGLKHELAQVARSADVVSSGQQAGTKNWAIERRRGDLEAPTALFRQNNRWVRKKWGVSGLRHRQVSRFTNQWREDCC